MGMVTIHSPDRLPRASSAIWSWMSRIERTRPRDGKTLRNASRSMCAWPSMRPGTTVLPLRSMTRVCALMCAVIASFAPTAMILSAVIAIAWAIVKVPSTVRTLPFFRTISAGRTSGVGSVRGGLLCAAEWLPASPLTAAAPAPAMNRRRSINDFGMTDTLESREAVLLIGGLAGGPIDAYASGT